LKLNERKEATKPDNTKHSLDRKYYLFMAEVCNMINETQLDQQQPGSSEREKPHQEATLNHELIVSGSSATENVRHTR